ncbi:MAG: CDC24 calponin-domain-containing protein, partial [Olpidium bornovanus]
MGDVLISFIQHLGALALRCRRSAVPPTSLYQQCLTLTDRLMCVPGFDRYMEPGLNGHVVTTPGGSFSPSMDPVCALWTAFRTGAALCVLFNAARPSEPLDVSDLQDFTNVNACKKGVYRFLVGCKKDFNFPEDRLFSITELYQDDTNGFVKVIRIVSDILSRIQEQGTLVKSRRPSVRLSDIDRLSVGPMGNREKVVTELLETERKYVSDLEELQNYMRQLQQADVVSQETIRWLFVNLNSLVDFQRRFLIGIEANA